MDKKNIKLLLAKLKQQESKNTLKFLKYVSKKDMAEDSVMLADLGEDMEDISMNAVAVGLVSMNFNLTSKGKRYIQVHKMCISKKNAIF